MTELRKFSDAEWDALEQTHKGILISQIEAKRATDIFGNKTAGMPVYKKLIKEGLIFITEEEDDWTPMLCFSEEGAKIFNQGRK
jgi:hypothetical protein